MQKRIKPREFFQQFLSDFKNETNCLQLGYSQMSAPLKEYFRKLGRKNGFEPLLTEKEGGTEAKHEYMIDLCWEASTKEKRWLQMAMEIELSQHSISEIIYDFKKLTDIKAILKVCIYSSYQKDYQEILDRCRELISKQRIKLANEQYLIIPMIESLRERGGDYNLEISGYLFDKDGNMENIDTANFVWER